MVKRNLPSKAFLIVIGVLVGLFVGVGLILLGSVSITDDGEGEINPVLFFLGLSMPIVAPAGLVLLGRRRTTQNGGEARKL